MQNINIMHYFNWYIKVIILVSFYLGSIKVSAQSKGDSQPILLNTVVSGEGLNVNFKAERSIERDDSAYDIQSWQWDFGDGHTANGSTIQHQFREAGRYKVCITAEGLEGIVRHCRGIKVSEDKVYVYDGMQISWQPSTSMLHIWFEDGLNMARLHLLSSDGTTLVNAPIAPESSPILLNKIAPGEYTFRIRQAHIEEDVFQWHLVRESYE